MLVTLTTFPHKILVSAFDVKYYVISVTLGAGFALALVWDEDSGIQS
jgi:hypothetical protein